MCTRSDASFTVGWICDRLEADTQAVLRTLTHALADEEASGSSQRPRLSVIRAVAAMTDEEVQELIRLYTGLSATHTPMPTADAFTQTANVAISVASPVHSNADGIAAHEADATLLPAVQDSEWRTSDAWVWHEQWSTRETDDEGTDTWSYTGASRSWWPWWSHGWHNDGTGAEWVWFDEDSDIELADQVDWGRRSWPGNQRRAEEGNRLYISNLPPHVTRAELHSLFKPRTCVVNMRIMRDRSRLTDKACAIVALVNGIDAAGYIRSLSRYVFREADGPLRVQYAYS